MSKKYYWLILAVLGIFFGFSEYQDEEIEVVRSGFVNPPDSVKVTAFYYWINNHISKEGVIKDLQAMKEAGITRVFIGSNIRNRTSWSRDTTGMWFGKVKVFSDEWWDILHTALKTASELKIEVGLFNCPGWSQSGGPWVRPEQAMRYLDASQLRIKGPLKIDRILSKTDTFFQDVKVLAMRVSPTYQQNLLNLPKVKLSSTNLKALPPSKNGNPGYVLADKESVLDIELPEAKTVRSITINPSEYLNTSVEVQVKNDTGFRKIQRAEIMRSRTVEDLAKGFEPNSPYFLPIDEITAKSFRLIFKKNGKSVSAIGEIILSPTPVIDHLPEKKLSRVVGSSPSWTGSLEKNETLDSKDLLFPSTEEVVDISGYMSADGRLKWNAPKGDWIIFRTGMRFINVMNGPASFEAEGLEVDKLSRKNIKMHFNAFIGQILKRIPSNDRRTLKMVIMDSYERGGTNFTDGFLEDFKKRYGYDATPYLPVYSGHIIGSSALSDRFLWDVRRLVADKLSFEYVGGMREISHQYGLRTWLENYGHSGYPGEFMQYGGQSDEVAGEYWVEPLSDNRFENRGAASTAHTYGKNKVWSESFTSGSWVKSFEYSTYPQELKSLGDQAFTQGVNSTVLHLYIQQAYENVYPGVDAWFGTEFNRKNTWFKHMDLFTLYHRRCNFMLQQGKNIADIAYYIGEDNPIMKGSLEPKLPKGFNYDYINSEVVIRDLQVKDGRFVLPNGTSYRLLVLPPQETMRPEVLEKIERLVRDGGIILGSPPSRSPSLQGFPGADQKVKSLSQKLWRTMAIKDNSYGKGRVFNKVGLTEVIQSMGIAPDFTSDKANVQYTHRTLNGKEIYFVANLSDKSIAFNATFRTSGLQPELWDPLTGETRILSSFEDNGKTTSVPLELFPNGSFFIVFNKRGSPSSASTAANFPVIKTESPISGNWHVSFEHDSVKRGPQEPILMKTLTDWAKSDDQRIRYFSGTAVYTNTFSIENYSDKKDYFIDLGFLSATAKVKVNGKYVGGAWTYPYRVNVSKAIKKGTNNLEVEVINTWRNRLIGDRLLPEKNRIVRSRIGPGNPSTVLQPSGLLGPVIVGSTVAEDNQNR